MKKTFDIILVYFGCLIAGIIVSSFLYLFYGNLLDYVAGTPVASFSVGNLIKSFMFVSSCILLFICPIVSYYRIRRPAGFSQTLGYIIIVILTWFLFFPSLNYLEKNITGKYGIENNATELSAGYFRRVGNKVYYFTKDFEPGDYGVPSAPALVIDTSEDGNVDYTTFRNYKFMDINKDAQPFTEILVKQNFDESRITLPVDLRNLIAKLRNCLNFKLYYLLYLFSFVLVISSIYAVSNFFNWKLLNAVLLFFITVSVTAANSSAHLAIFSYVNTFLSNTRPFVFLSQYIYEAFLFVFNVLLSIVFLTLGIVKFAVRKHESKN